MMGFCNFFIDLKSISVDYYYRVIHQVRHWVDT